MGRHRGASRAALVFVFVFAGAVAGCSTEAGLESSSDDVTREDVADRAEIKVVLDDATFDPGSLGSEPLHRDVTFYDTPSLDLWKQGVLFRSRLTPTTHEAEVTVKLRPMSPSRVDRSFRDDDSLKCELDVSVGGGNTSSCSLTAEVDSARVVAVERTPSAVERLWSDDALAFARIVAPEVDPAAFQALGPIASTTWKVDAPEIDEEITFERWDVPGGLRTLEASIKVKTENLRDKERDLVKWLEKRDLHRAATQTTKTAAALEALSTAVR